MAWITKPKKIHKKNKNKSTRTFNQSNKYYHNKLWRKLRDDYIGHHPLCERCLEYDRITPAVDVHHIQPFLRGKDEKERWELLLNPNNLMALCKRCHLHLHNGG